MLTEQEKKGLARILDISNSENAKTAQFKIDGYFSNNKSKEETTKAVLRNVHKSSEILRQENITRETLVTYLKEIGVRVQKEQSKNACIRICLDKWHVKDDNFWVKRPRSEERVLGDLLSHSHSNDMNEETKPNWEYCIKTNKLRKVVKHAPQQNILPNLKKQTEKKKSELPSTEVLTESQPKELPHKKVAEESLLIRKSPYKQKSSEESLLIRNSPYKQNSLEESLLITNLTSANSVNELMHESISFTESSDISSDTIGFFGKQSTSERQSDFPLNALNSVPLGENTSSRMMPSTEPSCFSTQLFNTDHMPSVNMTKAGCPSISDTPALSSLTSNWIDDEQSTQLPSTQPFSVSVETDDLPTASIMEDERKSGSVSSALSSVSSQSIFKKEIKPPKVIQSPKPKLVVRKSSVSDASVQTELTELQDNDLIISPGPQSIISSKEKEGKQLPKLHVASLSNLGDRASDFQNVKRRQTASSEECPNCKKRVDRNELGISSKTQGNNKKRPRSVSKVVASSAKERRLAMPSKPAKGAPASSDANRSAMKENKKIRKRQHPTSSPSEETLLFNGSPRQVRLPPKQQRYTPPTIFRERPKQSKLPFKTGNLKLDTALVKPKNDDEDSFFQLTDEESLKSEQTSESESSEDYFTLESESSEDCFTLESEFSGDRLPQKNPADKVTGPPRRSSSVPPKLLRGSESTLESPECTSEISAEEENSPTESSGTPNLDQPLRHPRRKCCVVI